MRRAYRRVLVATRQNVVASDRAVWTVRNVCQLQERVVVFFPHESTMPSSTSQPPSKKTRMDSDRTTRSAGSTSEPPPAAAAAAPAPAPRRNRDSDDMMEDDESEFEYDSDAIEPEGEEMEAIEIDDSDNDADAEGDTTLHGQGEMETITITDESDLDEPPPEPVSQPKGKLTSRKQFTAHIEMLVARYGAPDGEQVTGKSPPRASQAWPTRCAWLDRSFELTRAAPPAPADLRRDDEQVTFSLVHPAFPSGLKLVLDTPDLGGYPNSHQVMCYSAIDIGPDVQAVLAEVSEYAPHLLSRSAVQPPLRAHLFLLSLFPTHSLPERYDRSLPGLIEYLISRLILHQPAPFNASQASQADDDEDEDDDDHLFGIGGADMGQSTAFMDSLRRSASCWHSVPRRNAHTLDPSQRLQGHHRGRLPPRLHAHLRARQHCLRLEEGEPIAPDQVRKTTDAARSTCRSARSASPCARCRRGTRSCSRARCATSSCS